MDLIVINQEKLKIILNTQDMKKLNISAETMDYSNVATKRALWCILDEAHQSTGFDSDNCRLHVQVFPDNTGGCEIFVTKLPEEEDSVHKRSTGKSFRITDRRPKEEGIFCILTFDELCELCKRLHTSSPLLYTTLYLSPPGTYLLFMEPSKGLPSYTSRKSEYLAGIPQFVYEYGENRVITDNAVSYAKEHCRKIAEGNAALLLSDL